MTLNGTYKRLALMCLILSATLCAFAQKQLVEPVVTSDLISLQPMAEVESFTLKVSGPDGLFFETHFSGLASPFIELFDPSGSLLPDGQYAYELVATPIIPNKFKADLLRAREAGDAEARSSIWARVRPDFDLRHDGYFRIVQGHIALPGTAEPLAGASDLLPALANEDTADNGGGSPVVDLDEGFSTVIAMDLIVQGSACVGLDCVNGESFGFDTLRLKENNLRIKFQDTSTSASFPTNDWQITANDSSNGGANKFSVDDIDGGRTPFTIEASAPSHSLYVDDGGRIGLGTSTPVVELHVVNGDSPTLRLEQNGSSGFTPQTWDVAGNETNFFIRDVTGGSQLPLKIRPGADSNALVISNNNNVGLLAGTSPSASLHIRRTDGTAQLLIEEATSSSGARNLIDMSNDGPLRIRYQNSDNSTNWTTSNDASGFIIDSSGTVGEDLFVTNSGRFLIRPNGVADPGLVLENNGDMEIGGLLTTNSNRNKKKNFETVSNQEILDKVVGLPLAEWTYINDDHGTRHFGPMAQDFADAFGLGKDREHIATLDVGGVALAAIQGLNERLEAKDHELERKDAEIEALSAKNEEIQQRLQALEKLVEKLANKSE